MKDKFDPDPDYIFSVEDSIDKALKYDLKEKVTIAGNQLTNIAGKHKSQIWSIPVEDKTAKPYCQIAEYSIAPVEGIYNVRDLQFFLEEVQQAIDNRTGFPPEKIRDFTEDAKKDRITFGQLLYLDAIATVTEEKKELSEIMFNTKYIPQQFKGYLERRHTKTTSTKNNFPINVGVTIAFYPCEDIAKQQSPIDYISIKRFNKLNPEHNRFRNVFSWFEG